MNISELRECIDPVLGQPFGERLTLGDAPDELQLNTPYLAHPEYGSHFTALNITLRQRLGARVRLTTNYRPPIISQRVSGDARAIPGVKNILAVGSGKGGVGKSTVATLIAFATHLLGARVGLLDADIYGPNQLRLLGFPADARLKVTDNNRFTPLQSNGMPVMSFAGIGDEDTPVVWRGPMISNALQQLLLHTNWPELDLLVVDLPPGTGDIQLTLASSVRLAALVLVTTPQALAQSEAGKTLAMAGKLNIPVAGLVENMGRFVCNKCDTEHRPFGDGQRLSNEISLLGSLPIDPALQNASGKLVFDPANQSGLEAVQIAEATSLAIAKLGANQNVTHDQKPGNIIARELT